MHAGGRHPFIDDSCFDIGQRNVEVARAVFADRRLALVAEEVGSTIGRTMRVFVADGRMTICPIQAT
jgi:chemotaxis receptor (MCP) glutamine deamidase CheD